MQVREKTRKEIEARFEEMGDYVRIDYLSSCLKGNLDFDTRKFVLVKLAELFESRKMFLDAGKMMKGAAEINTTFKNKIEDFSRAVELFIKSGDYYEADGALKSALSISNESQREEVLKRAKENYKTQANFFISNDKRKHAMEVYEKILTMNPEQSEKEGIEKSLLNLYRDLGKIREYNLLIKRIKKD